MRNESTRTPSITPRPAAHSFLRALVVASFGFALLLNAAPSAAEGQTIDDPQEWKAEWQGRYLDLRIEEARLLKTIDIATKEYADANRRSYRRSGVRHFHHVNAEAARAKLEEVRKKKADLADEILDFGGFSYWIDEFEEEKLDARVVEGLGAYADGARFGPPVKEDVASNDGADDDGRNPLYKKEREPKPAAPETTDSASDKAADADAKASFDYIRWLEDREAYERELKKTQD